jgi:hypothetical protein
MSTHHNHDHQHRTSTTKQTINPRSNPSTPEHEINSPPQPTKFQPKIQNHDQEQPQTDEADLCITIRWGVRAVARRQAKVPRGDLGTRFVDLLGGGERC